MNRKAQVWVETVIYTLIALALIGSVLAFVRPKIQEMQDKTVIEQSIEIMEYIDSKISEVIRGGSGNTRIVDMGIKKGSLMFDSPNDQINFTIENTRHLYSEVGKEVHVGNVNILTTKKGGAYTVTLNLNYSERYNLKFDGNEEIKTLSKAPTPYKILFGNDGDWEKIGEGTVGQAQDIGGNYFSTVESVIPPLGVGPFIEPYEYKIRFTLGNLDGKSYFIEDVDAGGTTLTLANADFSLEPPNSGDTFDILHKTDIVVLNTKLIS